MTAAQRRVFDAITALHHEHGYPPSIREVMARADLKSPSTVMVHLYALRREGRVDWLDGAMRTLIAKDENGRRA